MAVSGIGHHRVSHHRLVCARDCSAVAVSRQAIEGFPVDKHLLEPHELKLRILKFLSLHDSRAEDCSDSALEFSRNVLEVTGHAAWQHIQRNPLCAHAESWSLKGPG